MQVAAVDKQIAKWRSWIEGPICKDVVHGMHVNRMIWREINEMLAENPGVANLPSAFWDYYHWNYAATQAIAVRRQADRGGRTCSLARLVEEMRDQADVLTREYFVGLWRDRADPWMIRRAHSAFDLLAGTGGDHLDPEVPARDLASLRSDAARMGVFVNEHVAHDMAEPTVADLPTFTDLHDAIDSVGRIFKKYSNVLTAGTYVALEPVIEEDWKAIFRQPWLKE